MNRARLLPLLAAFFAFTAPLAARPFTNAKVTTAAASPQLLRQIEAIPSHTWAGYAVPAAPRRGFWCDWDGDWSGDWNGRSRERDEPHPLAVFFRVEDHHIERVRVLSESCSLKATELLWIEQVDPNASLALVRGLITSGDATAAKQAVTALAVHDDAVDALIDVAKNHRDSHVRGDALFWLGSAAGQKATRALRDAVDDDPEESVRAKAVFGISNLPDDQSIPLLAELMRTHRSAAVRKKAAFWLSQKDDPRALAAIEQLLKQ